LTGHTNIVYTLAILSNGNLASGSADSTVKIWNPSTGSLVYTLTGHTNAVWTLATLPNYSNFKLIINLKFDIFYLYFFNIFNL
jgi:WD40 repeat protein